MLNKQRGFYILPLLLSFSAVAPAQNGTVSVTDFGALSNDTNPAATTSAFQQAFAAAMPSGKVVVPPGYYAIDNSQGGLSINGFNGEVEFDGQAQLMLQSNSQPGLIFTGGWGLRLYGAHLAYQNIPTSHSTGMAALYLSGVVNARVSNTIIEGSPGYGIWVFNCLEPKVLDATVMNSLDDGIRFENSRNSEIANGTILGAGQDGLDFVTAAGTAVYGAAASNIIVNSSLQGIAVNGTTNTTISNFYIESPSSLGIYCGTANGSAVPDAVIFQGGVINNSAGYGAQVGAVANCSFANIQILNVAYIGFYANANQGNVAVRNVRVDTNQNGVAAFNFENAGEVMLSESTASNISGYGFFFDTITRVITTGLTTYNVSQAQPLHRAVWYQNIGSLAASNLSIADTQTTPTGYVVGEVNIGHGSIQNIASSISFGALQVQNLANLPVAQVN